MAPLPSPSPLHIAAPCTHQPLLHSVVWCVTLTGDYRLLSTTTATAERLPQPDSVPQQQQGTPARTSAPYTTREELPARTDGKRDSRRKRRADTPGPRSRGDRARRRANAFGRTRRREKKGNLHRRAATRGGMRGGARRVRWGTASPPQPGLYLAAGHTRRRRATSQAARDERASAAGIAAEARTRVAVGGGVSTLASAPTPGRGRRERCRATAGDST